MKRKVLTVLLAAAVFIGVSTFAWANGSHETKSAATTTTANATGSSASTGAVSSSNDFITVTSKYDYSTTLNKLQKAIKADGLMVLGQVNQQAVMSMTGLKLEGAHSYLVGNPRVGKKLFGMTAEVATVIPGRISVWANHGTTYVGYFKPSVLMGMINSSLSKPGTMLDKKFKQIVTDATR